METGGKRPDVEESLRIDPAAIFSPAAQVGEEGVPEPYGGAVQDLSQARGEDHPP